MMLADAPLNLSPGCVCTFDWDQPGSHEQPMRGQRASQLLWRRGRDQHIRRRQQPWSPSNVNIREEEDG